MALAPGTRLGAYEILSLIGSGGMGEVYRARDVKLQRDVAIKILPARVAPDPAVVERFEREARAIAALNHPNVVTIYAVEESGGARFLAMELVDGQTLADAVAPNGLPLETVLKYAIPLADALSAAHTHGIMHRDLKPSNVMVARDGRVKVLDFGLAKLGEEAVQIDATVAVRPLTGQGQIVGTVSYMSPEQASGGLVDERTDLFALGVILYELATGRRPFTGESNVSVLASILKDTPKPIAELRPDLPRDFTRIARRALAKDPEQRYQTAKDLRNDLRTLKDDLTSGELSVSVPAGAPLLSRDTRPLRWAALGLAAATLAAVVYIVVSRRPLAVVPDSTAITRLTSTGKASAVAISPDGKYVVHVVTDHGYSLWARQVATSANVQIVPPGSQRFVGMTFSPDGNYVYFARFAAGTSANLYRVPILGGQPDLVVKDVDSAPAFSPDGSRFAFLRGAPGASEIQLLISAANGGERPTVVARRPLSDPYPFYARLAWSPNGRTLAVPVGGDLLVGGARGAMLAMIDVTTGHERPITPRRWDTIGAVAWLSDATVLVSGTEGGRPNFQISRVAVADGTTRRVTNDLNTYQDVSVAAATKTVATVLGDSSSTISVGAPGDPAAQTAVTSGTGRYDGQLGIVWTPDGRIVFTSAVAGQSDLWIMDGDGRNARQLTSDGDVESNPTVSSDGGYVVCVVRGEKSGLWRLNLDGGLRARLTDDAGDSLPHFLADGKSIVFTRLSPQILTYRVGLEGGQATKIGDGFVEAVSPDGRLIGSVGPTASGPFGLRLTPLGGGPSASQFDIINVPIMIDWTPRGDAVTFLDSRRETQSIWNQPVAGGPPTEILDLHGERIFSFAWSRDGRLAVAHGPVPTDVVLMTGIRD